MPPSGSEEIQPQRGEAGERHAPRHILDMRVEAAILVDHQHAAAAARGLRRHEIAFQRDAIDRLVEPRGGDPGIVGRDLLGLGIVRLQQGERGLGRRGRAGEHQSRFMKTRRSSGLWVYSS